MADKDSGESTRYYLMGHRRIPIDGELNIKLIQQATNSLIKLDFDSNKPITLLLSSEGGSYEATMQLGDLIASLNSPVDVVAYGDCASMAVDLIQMCRKRMLLPSTRLLVHYLRMRGRWICDDPEGLEADIALFRRDMAISREKRFSLYRNRTGLTDQKILEMFRYGETHGAHFSAEQAVESKLADEILTDFKLFPGRKYEGED